MSGSFCTAEGNVLDTVPKKTTLYMSMHFHEPFLSCQGFFPLSISIFISPNWLYDFLPHLDFQ